MLRNADETVGTRLLQVQFSERGIADPDAQMDTLPVESVELQTIG